MLIILDKNEYNYTKNNLGCTLFRFVFGRRKKDEVNPIKISNSKRYKICLVNFHVFFGFVKSIFDGGENIVEVRDCNHHQHKF